MSGPKYSEAELAMMRAIEEERRRLCQDIAREVERLKRCLNDIKNLGKKAVLVHEEKEVSGIITKLESYQEAIKKEVGVLESVVGSRNNDTIRNALEAADFDYDSFDKYMSESEKKIMKCREKRIEKHLEKIAQIRQKSIQTAETGETEKREIIPKEFLDSEINRIKLLLDNLDKRADAVFLSKDEPEKLRDCVMAVLDDTERDNYSMYEELNRIEINKIEPFERKIKKLEKEADELDRKLSAELATYHRICAEIGVEPKKFQFRKESIEEIRYACAELLDQCDLSVDLSALMKGIKESLTGLGYSYLGEKEENRDLYRQIYGIHDNIILHVIYDSTGRVTMEVAIKDNISRVPQPREKEGIVKEQEKFCKDYEKIFDAVNRQGIALRKKAEMPCNPAFAKVINTSEFTCPEQSTDDYYEYYSDRTTKYLHVK